MKPLLIIDGTPVKYRKFERSIEMDELEPVRGNDGRLYAHREIRPDSLRLTVTDTKAQVREYLSPRVIRRPLPDGNHQYEVTTK